MNRITSIMLLTMFFTAALSASAGAPALRTGDQNRVYLFVREGGRLDDFTSNGSIWQLNQNANGSMTKLKQVPTGWIPTDCQLSRKRHLLFALKASGTSGPRPVVRFNGWSDSGIRPESSSVIPNLLACQLLISSDEQHLFTIEGNYDTVCSYSIGSDGSLTRISSWRQLGESDRRRDSGNAVRGDNVTMLLGMTLDIAGRHLYIPEFYLPDERKSAILQFQVTSDGELQPMAPFRVHGEAEYGLTQDRKHGFMAAFSFSGQILAYKAGSKGELSAMSEGVPEQAGDHEASNLEAPDKDDLVPIIPAPALRPPPIKTKAFVFDDVHDLLIGVGGTANNEIDIWRTSSRGVGRLVNRLWFDESGFFPGADPRAQPTVDMATLAGTPAIWMSQSSTFLYVMYTSYKFTPQQVTTKLFCFRVTPEGSIREGVSTAELAKELSNLEVLSLLLPGSAD